MAVCGRLEHDSRFYACRDYRDCGEPVRAGWILVLMGVGSAVIGQHMDAYVMGALLVVCGLLALRLKGV